MQRDRRKNHITAFHLIYIGRKKSDLVKPHEACKRYCKREQRKFTFNLSSAAISYPMSKAKFVHARGEKSHFEKNFFSTTDKTNYLTNLQKETGCFESKNRLFFLAKA